MIGTMQNWTDATQGRLPSYYERIVGVPLTPNEGGLNLDMPPTSIADLSACGVMAIVRVSVGYLCRSGKIV